VFHTRGRAATELLYPWVDSTLIGEGGGRCRRQGWCHQYHQLSTPVFDPTTAGTQCRVGSTSRLVR